MLKVSPEDTSTLAESVKVYAIPPSAVKLNLFATISLSSPLLINKFVADTVKTPMSAS